MALRRALGLAAAGTITCGAALEGHRALPGSVEQTLIKLEKESWRAWQDKDLAFWNRHLSADHIEMDEPDGPTGKNEVLSAIASRNCTVTKYNLENFTFRQFDRGTAILVYRETQEFACGTRASRIWGGITSIDISCDTVGGRMFFSNTCLQSRRHPVRRLSHWEAGSREVAGSHRRTRLLRCKTKVP